MLSLGCVPWDNTYVLRLHTRCMLTTASLYIRVDLQWVQNLLAPCSLPLCLFSVTLTICAISTILAASLFGSFAILLRIHVMRKAPAFVILVHTCERVKCYQARVHDYIHTCPNAVDFNPKCELWLRISKLSPGSQVKCTSLTAWSCKLLCYELNTVTVLQGPDVRVG